MEDIPAVISQIKTSLTNAQIELSSTRLQIATAASELHAQDREVLRKSIAILEQTIHGAVARGSKAQADYLSTVAEGMSKKLALQRHQIDGQLYTAEMMDVLKAKSKVLEQRNAATRRKMREAEETLEKYRKVGGLEGVAREFAEVTGEQERVREEIARLESGGR